MLTLTGRAEKKLSKTVIEPQVIVEIPGLPLLGAAPVYKMAKFDDPGLFFDMPGLFFDVPTLNKDAKKLINLSGSSASLTQQVFQDKGMASSVPSMTIEIVDKDEELTRYISPGIEIAELLTEKAIVYLNFGGGAHPEDSVPILFGIIDAIDAGAGAIKLTIAHPDGLKRQEVFTQIQSKTTAILRYRNKYVQGISYQTQDIVDFPYVTVTIVGGGTAGSEVISVAGHNITIQIQAGVTKASDIVSAVRKSQAATDLIHVEVPVDANNTLLQNTNALFTLDSDTTLALDSTAGMLLPTLDGTVETYVRIGDEIIRYTGISGNTLTGIEGAQFDTIGKTYEIDEDVQTFYRIQGSMTEVALKLMLSRGAPLENIPARGMVYANAITDIQNGIFFQTFDVGKKYGVSVGDFVSSTLSAEAANNFVNRRIVNVSLYAGGSYIIVDGPPLVSETFTAAVMSFRSKYDVWPDGLGMQIDQVDVEQHEKLASFFPSGFFPYDFYLKDTIKGDEFLAKEVYFPSGCYALPRGGRASVGITLPPLAQAETVTLDETNVVNPSAISIQRTINKNFYNAVVYKFGEDPVDDEFKSGVVTLSSPSISRVKNVKNKPLTIEAKGIRDTPGNRNKIATLTKRYLDRFQFGAESFEVEVLYKVGFKVEAGDTVIFGSSKLQLSDSTIGSRKFKPRIVEVQNKKLNALTGRVNLSLLSTAFTTDANYGVVAPSSEVDGGSTASRVRLKKFITTPEFKLEQYKWLPYVGEKVLFHDAEWTYQEEAILRGFVESDPNVMILNPPLSVAPGEGIIIDAPYYPVGTDPEENALWKAIHMFYTPQIHVVAHPLPNKIEVDSADVFKFFVGSPLRIHKEDYSVDTGDVEFIVQEITGNFLILNAALPFTVDSTFLIDLVGFPDGRAPYRLL